MLVQIPWHANPLRGDKMEEGLRNLAEAALDYGAEYWLLTRSGEGLLDFLQIAVFPSKLEFERYWYSEEVAEQRIKLAGWFQVPVLPSFHRLLGEGRAVTPESA